MAIATAPSTGTKSGTTWTIDVTSCGLLTSLSEKDFVVYNLTAGTTLDNANFTKTSSVLLTYSGPDVGTNQNIEVRRYTDVSTQEYVVQYGASINSVKFNSQTERILRRLAEIEDRLSSYPPAP